MTAIMHICLFLCLVTLTWLQFADSAGMTKATPQERKEINALTAMWGMHGVTRNSKIKTLYPPKPPFIGSKTKQHYRLDEEQPTSDGFNKYRIQSGSKTYSDVLVRQDVEFGKRKIRNAFVTSTLTGQNVKLDRSGKLYTGLQARTGDAGGLGDSLTSQKFGRKGSMSRG